MAKQEQQQDRGLTVYQARDGSEIKLSFDTVKKYLVSGKGELVTDQEIMLYMGMCKARGLNPFKRDCYLVKYTDREAAAIIVSIDYFRARARAQRDCVGWQCGIIILNDDGTLLYREGSFLLEDEKLVGGWFKAKPQGWEVDYNWNIALSPYIKKRGDGQVTQFWSDDKQAYMIAKVVESQGLRRVWPDEFQGLMVEEELTSERDVTEHAETLKMPRAIDEGSKANGQNAKAENSAEATTRHRPNDRPTTEDTASDNSVPADTGTHRAEKNSTDAILEIITGASAEDFEKFDRKWLSAMIKDKSQEEQLRISRAYNERKNPERQASA